MHKVCFVINVFNEWDMTKKRCEQIRDVYPDADIITIADGTKDADFGKWAAENKVSHMESKPLKKVNGGAWLKRWMSFAIFSSDAYIFLKIDPDTTVNRQLSFIPVADYFGCTGNEGATKFKSWKIQGGCYGITRLAIQQIIDSSRLDDPAYRSSSYISRRLKGQYCESLIFDDVAKKCRLSFFEHPEIYACVKPGNFEESDFAIIHPENWREVKTYEKPQVVARQDNEDHSAPSPAILAGLRGKNKASCAQRQSGPMPKVFGIGLSKTGTRSLNEALNILGIPSVHYPWKPRRAIQEYQGGTDIPFACQFDWFDRKYPGSKFIYTTRDLDDWLKSMEYHFNKRVVIEKKENPALRENLQKWRMKTYGTVDFDPERLKQVNLSHFNAIADYFKDRENDIIILDVCAGEGWEKLCEFLDKPIPDQPFPHANKTNWPKPKAKPKTKKKKEEVV